MTVTCHDKAAAPGIAAVKSTTKAMMFGNLIFGGIIGGGGDAADGAAYSYPSPIIVQMGKVTTFAPPPPATPAPAKTTASNQ